MRPAKIVVIGAGSASFGLSTLCDAVNTPEVRGSTLVLVDINEEALDTIAALAHKLNEESGAGLQIYHTTDRTEALPGADFVIISIAVNREELWKLDWQVPIKHGVKHTLGENGGPGGLFHTMRNIPIILDICHDIEHLCPDALVLNFTNPVPRICMAIDRFTNVNAVGLCHGIGGQLHRLAQVMGVDPANLDAKAAGLNHFTWILDLRLRDSGDDAYPLLRRRLADYDPDFQPLSRMLFDAFGFFPSPGDDHVGEYLSFATEYCPMHGYDFAAAERYKTANWERIRRLVKGEEPVAALLNHRSGERAFHIIAGILSNSNHLELAVNVANNGLISNLPCDAIVEVPAVISASGVRGVSMGMLPMGIAALCQTQVSVQELAVTAGVTGDREIARQALLADPVIHSAEAADRILDELLSLEAQYLPQFSGDWAFC